MLQHTTRGLARWRHYPRLKDCVKLQVYRPSERQWKPRLRQAAGTLADNGGQYLRKQKNDELIITIK